MLKLIPRSIACCAHCHQTFHYPLTLLRVSQLHKAVTGAQIDALHTAFIQLSWGAVVTQKRHDSIHG